MLFSGQGAQKTGMGQDLYDHNETYRQVIDQASDTLEMDLPKLYFDKAESAHLNATSFTQPAIVAMSLALYEAVKPDLHQIVAGIGLSLGEYSALAASGFLTETTALQLIKRRGKLMQEASDLKPSKMVAIMSTPIDLIQAACESGRQKGVVAIANVNTPKQVVIGGEVAAVDLAVDFLSNHDVSRMVPLQVSGAFHTPLMAPAQTGLNQALQQVNWQKGSFPVISNTTNEPFKTTSLTTTLTNQLVSTTRFADAIQQLAGQIDAVIELGPGKTLMSFARKTIKGINYYHIDDQKTLDETLTALRSE
nr:ACP S-malonyltransferase [Secundilactobacillus folii]